MNFNEVPMDAYPLYNFILTALIPIIIIFLIMIIYYVSIWKIFKKANRKGWESLVPVHNMFVLMEIAGTPTWHIFLSFIPWVCIYVLFRVSIDLSHKFGKSTGFGVATAFFSMICLPILAFSKKINYGEESFEETEVETESYNNDVEPFIMNQTINMDIPILTENVNPVEEIKPIETPQMPNPTNADLDATLINIEPINFNKQPEQMENLDIPLFTQNPSVVENIVPFQNSEVQIQEPLNVTNNLMNESIMNFSQPMNRPLAETVQMPVQNVNNVGNIMPSQPTVVPPMQPLYTEQQTIAPTPNMVQPPVTNQQVVMPTQNHNQNGTMM